MCGICGVVNFDKTNVSEHSLSLMIRAMKHRGPDDEGLFIEEDVGLGFVRLSILDLSKEGHQPMISNDNNYVLIFNGEIYNYLEIRQELLLKGYSFRSETDSEVLLNAYIEWGYDFLNRLNGMFAFAIFNRKSKELFCARDRFGIKPFYYKKTKDQFLFASDIPSILTSSNNHRQNDKIIYDYLLFNRINHTDETFFEDIFKLPHGHFLVIKNNILEIKKWYDLNESIKKIKINNFNEQNFFESLNDSVKLQLRSDVEVGTCLSGGLDSSAITSLAQQNSINSIHSFSAVYGKGIYGDESNFIDLFSQTNTTNHTVKPTADSLLNDIYRFHSAISEPVPNTSEYAEFKVMELAKNYCKVILNGQGADEIMGGYHYFFGYYFKELLFSLKLTEFFKEVYFYLRIHKSLFGIKTFLFALSPRLFNRFKKNYLSESFKKEYSHFENPILDKFYNSTSMENFMIKHFEYKFEHHLLWADKSGMFFSIEARFPFLDHKLVESTLASGKTIKNGWTKYLLRDAFKGILPEEIRKRVDKMGYQTPEAIWFKNNEIKELVKKLLTSDKFRNRKYLDRKKVNCVLNKYFNEDVYNPEIWKWLSLEIWFNQNIDNKLS